ncbi:MAG: DUF4411 family protein [Methylophilaceae bacterium]|nr:DUF4411 family protein [Methylophilaceae bacterium]
MSKYVIDSSSLIHLGQFFPSRFPTLWSHFEELSLNGKLISVRECRKEIESYGKNDHIKQWAKNHSGIFLPATLEESHCIAQIFAIKHFNQLISEKAILQGKAVADPFLIASAKVNNSTLVTEELWKENAAKLPNVCEHFNITYITLEQLMEKEGLSF